MKVMGWDIRYDLVDSSQITSEGRGLSWLGLPDDKVQAIMLYNDEMTVQNVRYRTIYQGYDHYFQAPSANGGTIYGANNDPVEDIKRRYPGAIILRGSWADDDEYKAILASIHKDRTF